MQKGSLVGGNLGGEGQVASNVEMATLRIFIYVTRNRHRRSSSHATCAVGSPERAQTSSQRRTLLERAGLQDATCKPSKGRMHINTTCTCTFQLILPLFALCSSTVSCTSPESCVFVFFTSPTPSTSSTGYRPAAVFNYMRTLRSSHRTYMHPVLPSIPLNRRRVVCRAH